MAFKASPADPAPSVCRSPDREERRLAPDWVKTDELTDALRDTFTPEERVGEARERYKRIETDNHKGEEFTAKGESQRKTYKRILGADRHFQETFEGVTTVLLTLRISPLNDTGEWDLPWVLDQKLHANYGSVVSKICYELRDKRGFNCEYVSVTAPTEWAGTPHIHILIYVEDPLNEVREEWFTPVIAKHVNNCENAKWKHHQGSDGAVSVWHDPIAKLSPKGQIPGAQYLADQLSHLKFTDYWKDDRPNPVDPLIEGYVLSWVSPNKWFKASGGVPAVEDVPELDVVC